MEGAVCDEGVLGVEEVDIFVLFFRSPDRPDVLVLLFELPLPLLLCPPCHSVQLLLLPFLRYLLPWHLVTPVKVELGKVQVRHLHYLGELREAQQLWFL